MNRHLALIPLLLLGACATPFDSSAPEEVFAKVWIDFHT
ncbi:MAG: hypothetical protein ACI9F9_001400 [Candidatus Paceibacteria bacterium]|jgi:hypothetical protein